MTMDAIEMLIADAGGVRALALRLGYAHSYISRIRLGQSTPSFEFLRRVREIYGLRLDPATFRSDSSPTPAAGRPGDKRFRSPAGGE